MKLLHILIAVLLPLFSFAQQRVIAIGGDVTEIIYALNAEQNLVARDSTSLVPAQVKALPDIGYMRQLNSEGILALKPTLVISSELAQPSVVLEQLKNAGVKVETVPVDNSAQGVVTKIERIGQILDKTTMAKALAEQFQQAMAKIPTTPLQTKILFIMSHSNTTPLVAGQQTVADTIITMSGAKNAVQGVARYTPLSQEGLITANPDLIVISQNSVESLGGLDKLWQLVGMAHTNAGKQQQAVVVDDVAFLTFGLNIPQELQKIRTAAELVEPK